MIPIVLHHGIFGFGNFRLGAVRFAYFAGGIERAISERGHPLIISRVHPTAGIARRARQLKEIILRQLDLMGRTAHPVVLLAHSMGGLDARYMISCLGMAQHVRALVTISTPHRGSAFADWCLHNLGRRLGGLGIAKFLRMDIGAISDLTLENCRRFNERVPDMPGVKYYSVSASRPWHAVPPFALHSWRVINAAEGDNDCLVSVRSALWGKHLGTWPVDHFREINKRLAIDPGGVANVTPYYLGVLDTLRAEGVDLDDIRTANALQNATPATMGE